MMPGLLEMPCTVIVQNNTLISKTAQLCIKMGKKNILSPVISKVSLNAPVVIDQFKNTRPVPVHPAGPGVLAPSQVLHGFVHLMPHNPYRQNG